MIRENEFQLRLFTVLPNRDIQALIKKFQKDFQTNSSILGERYAAELSTNLFEITDKASREAYILENIIFLLRPLKEKKYLLIYDELPERKKYSTYDKLIYDVIVHTMAISMEIEYQCRLFSLDFPTLLKKAYFETENFNFTQEWNKEQTQAETQSDEPLKESNYHDGFNPNYWNKPCYNLFRYLADNYTGAHIKKYVYVWFYLREYDRVKYSIKCSRGEYKKLIRERYNVLITNFDRHDNYHDKVKPILDSLRISFEDSLKQMEKHQTKH